MLTLVGVLAGLVAGASVTAAWLRTASSSRVRAAENTRRQLLSDVEREVETRRREAEVEVREEAVRLRAEIEHEVQDRRVEIAKVEERVVRLEADIEDKLVELQRREQGASDRETHLKQLQEDLKTAKQGALEELQRISGMTLGEARQQLLERSEDLVRHELARDVRQMEEEARTDARRRARALVADALQRVAASHTAETTVTVVELASDDMKGRIIGREGRNIRALEHLTGVDFIIDDTPHAVVLSSFDGIRREVARLTLEKLMEDGRIHPARIEEMYYQSKAELEEHVQQAGAQAVFEANCGEFHEELVKILGRLRYRTSYGQNVLKHTLEVVHLAGLMASELGAGAKTTKRAALLHDIGKAMTHEVEGSHAAVSAQLAKRFGESEGVVHAIEAHHYEVQPQTVEAVLLITADAISASRPGARGESLEHYIKRLEIAREIEDQLEYPGQVKVTVIRESRSVDVAGNKPEHRREAAHSPLDAA
jgi:ribonuclease Y